MIFEKEKIEDLFLMMSIKDNDLEQAHNAFNEFHRRYAKYLYEIIKRACASFIKKYGDTLIENVFFNTLFRIYEKAETFMVIDTFDNESKKKTVKGWLGKIALNEMRTLLRENKKEDDKILYDTNYINEKDIIANEESKEKPPKTFERKLLEGALQSLKEQHREILLTYFAYEEEGKYMPSNVLDELCSMHSTTRENLRQIKKRSLEKVKTYIIEHQKNKNYGQK